jgi:hypothetical protein
MNANDHLGGGTLFSATLPVGGGWHFFHFFFDPGSLDFGFSIDNGSKHYSGMGPFTWVATPSGYIELFQVGSSSEDVYIDELGFKFDKILTDAQVTYLYNGGAGRTWPLT